MGKHGASGWFGLAGLLSGGPVGMIGGMIAGLFFDVSGATDAAEKLFDKDDTAQKKNSNKSPYRKMLRESERRTKEIQRELNQIQHFGIAVRTCRVCGEMTVTDKWLEHWAGHPSIAKLPCEGCYKKHR